MFGEEGFQEIRDHNNVEAVSIKQRQISQFDRMLVKIWGFSKRLKNRQSEIQTSCEFLLEREGNNVVINTDLGCYGYKIFSDVVERVICVKNFFFLEFSKL